MCDSGAVKLKAGANRNSSLTNADYEQAITQAESYINVVTRNNYTDSYAALNADVQKILEDACSSHAAMVIINNDMSGFTSRQEAQVMLDFNYSRLLDCIKLLKEQVNVDFINEA